MQCKVLLFTSILHFLWVVRIYQNAIKLLFSLNIIITLLIFFLYFKQFLNISIKEINTFDFHFITDPINLLIILSKSSSTVIGINCKHIESQLSHLNRVVSISTKTIQNIFKAVFFHELSYIVSYYFRSILIIVLEVCFMGLDWK